MSDDNIKKAFDLVAEITKQMITLATGVVAIVITFFDKTNGPSLKSLPLKIGLVLYLLSIMFGILALMAAVGNLSEKDKPTPYAPNIRFFSVVQIILFLGGTGSVILLIIW